MLSVRIDSNDHKLLRDLSAQTQRPMADLLSTAIEDLRRKFILEATNNAYLKLRKNKRAWTKELAERKLWESATVADADLDDWK